MSNSVQNRLKVFVRLCWGTLLLLHLTGCEKVFNLEKPPLDPKSVFDEVWKVMDEKYALFPLKGIDWNSKYQEYALKISDKMTDQELFKVIGDMLQTLQDGHVSLISKFDTSTYSNFYLGFP